MNEHEPTYLSRAQVREVDRIAIEEYGIPGIVLMENAARGAADHIVEYLGATSASIGIVCGNGNNGGDGFAIARHLHNRGHRVTTLGGLPGKLSADCQTNHTIAQRMGIAQCPIEPIIASEAQLDLFIDALVGTGLRANPSDQIATAIAWMNRTGVSVIAIDIPSGLDCDTGLPLGEAVKAIRTITFVAPKIGFANTAARGYTGDIVVADIGVPAAIVAEAIRRFPHPATSTDA